MHKGVLRDIALEEEERRLHAAPLAGASSAALMLHAAPPAGSPSERVCEGDICDLAATRFRNPQTGEVYVPGGR